MIDMTTGGEALALLFIAWTAINFGVTGLIMGWPND